MPIKTIRVHEFEKLDPPGNNNANGITPKAHAWLLTQARTLVVEEKPRWVTEVRGDAIKFTSHVGVVRTPDGTHIEVLPKVYKVSDDKTEAASRKLLVNMLCCLKQFRHANVGTAMQAVQRMPLLEVFIAQFLAAVAHAVKRGLRSHYELKQDNLPALRGKLLISQQIRQNLVRPDRFFTEHDEFTTHRPENRLMRLALERVMKLTSTADNQRLARELLFAFADIPASVAPVNDLQKVRLDRGMGHYAEAMEWTRWVLDHLAPVPESGATNAPALMYPMEALFEAYVAKHLRKQLNQPEQGLKFRLREQVRSECLVKHEEKHWFALKPDLLITGERDRDGWCVLDTKWKLLDTNKANAKEKYGLIQGDLYQLQAHGLSYLGSGKDVVLIYPRTEKFKQPLPPFEYNRASDADGAAKHPAITLWVLPFCLETKALLLPILPTDKASELHKYLRQVQPASS